MYLICLILFAAFFACGYFFGGESKEKSPYDVYKRTNGLFEPVKRD